VEKKTTGEAEPAVKKAEVKKPQVPAWQIGRYVSLIRIRPIKGTRLVEIVSETPDARLSQQLAEAHAVGFIRMSLETRFEITKEARDFLDGKNVELKEKLQKAEDALNRFRQTHGVVSMEKGENIVVDRLVDLNRQLTALRGQRIDAESLYKVVENKPTQYLSQVLTQGMVPALRSSLLQLEAEKVKLSTVFKPDHPRMIELNQQISEITRNLNREIDNVVRGIREAYIAARTREQALQAEADKQQQSALNLKEVGVQYAVLQEEVNVNRALYESVLKRLNETHISNDLAFSNMQITQHAEKPLGSSGPNLPLFFSLYFFLGAFLGVGLVFFVEYLDSSVTTPQHVWRAVGLSTFGVVPDMSTLKGRLGNYGPSGSRRLLPALSASENGNSGPAKDLIVSHHPLSLITESYRTIRTALLFSRPEKPPQVIVLTSPSPSEGKTATTLNLGIALAQDGYKILVIDADLRKGCCHTRLGVRNHRGLSNVLTGNLALEDGIQRTSVGGLSLLSRGICPPNPGELLGSNKMRQVLKTLREQFNFILIDSPPAIAVSDAAVLSMMCDGVIMVFNGRKTTTASARQAIERLDAIRAPILGAVLNRIDLGNPDYSYYRYYYGSDYGAAAEALDNGGQTVLKASVGDDAGDNGTWPDNFGPGTVPQVFFNEMIAKLSEAVGPMAALIVQDQIVSLGESRENFPKRRLRELFDGICEEILDEKLKSDFQRKFHDDMRAL
jgi:capsular exopolysaccharide synthesis family protein